MQVVIKNEGRRKGTFWISECGKYPFAYLQWSGRMNELRVPMLSGIERGPAFLRLTGALPALYPKDSDEKRLLDGVLLVVPR
jgi:hypothetical protein